MPSNGRRLKKTIKRRKGGSFIGRGASGCVYKPALRCKEDATRREGKLSKLMTQEYAEQEFRQRTLFEPLNAKQTFFLYPDTMCEPELPFEASNEVEKCTLDSFNGLPDKEKRILMITDGGTSLSDTGFIRPGNMYQVLASLTNVFKGLILAHAAGIVHMDVKPHNIVTEPKGRKFITRLIDFGLSLKIDTLPVLTTIPDEQMYDFNVFMANYPYWGPDLRLVKPDYLNDLETQDILEQESALKKKFPGANISSKLVLRSDDWLINNDYNKYYVLLDKARLLPHTFFSGDNLLLNKKWVIDIADKLYRMSDIDRWTLVFKKNDVFGLGQSILEIYRKSIKLIHLGYPMLAQEMAAAIDVHLANLYHKMTYPDPFVRITIEEALDIYTNDLLPRFAVVLRVSEEDVEAAKP
jgi:serine/threonine protein kinase